MTPPPDHQLLLREVNNPILAADHLPHAVNSVLNPGATRLTDVSVLLLRVENLRATPLRRMARSDDGAPGRRFELQPFLAPDPVRRPGEVWGRQDPRLTWLPEREEGALACPACSPHGPLVSLALPRDIRELRRIGPVTPSEDKGAVLSPRRVDGRWAMWQR